MLFSKELMKGTAEIVVLQTIKDLGESYGYQLTKAISEQSKNIFELQEGTLYPLLYRLEEQGSISSVKKVAPSGKERRYYSITANGKKKLKESKKSLGFLFKGVKSALHLSV